MEGSYKQLAGGIAPEQRTQTARDAFANRDIEKSVTAHALAPPHKEQTGLEGKFVKPIIFGGLDGVSTIFAFLAGAVGADLSLPSIVALGCAQLFAGAFGMGFGEYLSSEAERQVAQREEARERWEVEVNPEGEVNEMIHIYMDKGIGREDAEVVAKTLSKYPDFWVEHMMLTEIGMMPPEGGAQQSLVQGLIMFLSFLLLGGLPLVIHVVSHMLIAGEGAASSLGFTCAAAVIALFILGMLKAYVAEMSMLKGGFGMAVQGIISAGGAYAIGTTLPAMLHLS
eukprot:TRINITY_DN23413_c0_g1_i1.p1 TRINITY_DN23413_c0_g1~~TRINITY_DN23413_c0_g1_i1.p1  ORF type:complete len:283 (+),score=68.34 TRINITY_DN23413_c0_g1_i1:54-902(+)